MSYPGGRTRQFSLRREQVDEVRRWLGNYQKLKFNHFYDVTKPDKDHDNLGPQPQGQRIFYRSDHYNFAKVGIPIVFFTTGLHSDYHAITDEVSKIEFDKLTRITQMVYETGLRVANLDHAPARDNQGPRAGRLTQH